MTREKLTKERIKTDLSREIKPALIGIVEFGALALVFLFIAFAAKSVFWHCDILLMIFSFALCVTCALISLFVLYTMLRALKRVKKGRFTVVMDTLYGMGDGEVPENFSEGFIDNHGIPSFDNIKYKHHRRVNTFHFKDQ